MVNIAIMDDYQQVTQDMADWNTLPADTRVTALSQHVEGVDALVQLLRDFEVIVANRERTPFGHELLERLPNLKLLITTGARNSSIDLNAATELGIVVSGTRGGGKAPAELAWGLILALVRHIPYEDSAVRQGHWQTTVGTSLEGKVLGVLGLGNLGSRMAVIGAAFGMSIIAWSQNLTAERAASFGAALVTKDDLFVRSDVLTIHLQLSDRTKGLVGIRELSLMKPTSYLINTSRGPIVNEAALIRALQAKSIAGAGLDVFDEEPLPADHPLRHLENTVVTPHLGYVTKEIYRVHYGDSVENIAAYLHERPVRVLNPDVLEKNRRR